MEIDYSNFFATDPMAGFVGDVNITVDVQGSVTAEEDLAETIYDTFLDFQKSGKGLLYSNTVI